MSQDFDMSKMMAPMMGVVMVGAMMSLFVGSGGGGSGGGNGELSNTCPYCGLSFATLDELIVHVDTVHPDKPPWSRIDIDWGA